MLLETKITATNTEFLQLNHKNNPCRGGNMFVRLHVACGFQNNQVALSNIRVNKLAGTESFPFVVVQINLL